MTTLRTSLALAVLAMGASVYVLLRPHGLLLFDVLQIGSLPLLVEARSEVASLAHSSWLRFSFPDACWTFAATFTFASIWRGADGASKMAWTLAVPLIAVASEIGQAIGVVPGTFDLGDVIAYVLGAVAGAALASRKLVGDEPTGVTA